MRVFNRISIGFNFDGDIFGQCNREASYALWAGPLVSSVLRVPLTPASVLDPCDKPSFVHSRCFPYRNSTCEIHVRAASVHVR